MIFLSKFRIKLYLLESYSFVYEFLDMILKGKVSVEPFKINFSLTKLKNYNSKLKQDVFHFTVCLQQMSIVNFHTFPGR